MNHLEPLGTSLGLSFQTSRIGLCLTTWLLGGLEGFDLSIVGTFYEILSIPEQF